jgi:hypothetical protein
LHYAIVNGAKIAPTRLLLAAERQVATAMHLFQSP